MAEVGDRAIYTVVPYLVHDEVDERDYVRQRVSSAIASHVHSRTVARRLFHEAGDERETQE